MRIEQVGPEDEATLVAIHEHQVRVGEAQPYGTAWTVPELRVAAGGSDPWTERTLLAGRLEDGSVVASAMVEFPLRDNTDTAWVRLTLDPGVTSDGGAFVEELKARGRVLGRRRVETTVTWPPDEDDGPVAVVLRAHGFTLGLVEAQRVLDLPADDDALRALADEAAPHHRRYALRTWRGAVPDDVIEPYAAMRAIMAAEVPSGDLGWEAEDFTPERVRREEAEIAAQERVRWTTVAVADDGALAGHTELAIPAADRVNAYQWDTLVLRGHRGHRLGLAMKVANLRAAAEDLAPRALVHTWNAVENSPMIVVNERMGFRLAALTGHFRCDL